MSAKARRRRKARSCAALRRRARRESTARRRARARARLPKRCRVRPPAPPRLPPPSGGTQPPRPAPPVAASGTPAASPAPEPAAGAAPLPEGPALDGGFGLRDAERLLWRAGFGPRPGEAARLAAQGLDAAVAALTRVSGPAGMIGAEPHDQGRALDPYGTWGDDHLWWLDRMVRSDQPLVERMALIFHDWFATSRASVNSPKLMLQQVDLFRRHGLGRFDDLLAAVTTDPAMLVWLSGADNRDGAINENYGRELMELFTLGAGRGAYTERDVRELARALSGWRVDWVDPTGWRDRSWFDPRGFDAGPKTVFGQTGAWGTADALRLVLDHPLHASFFVAKLWSAFVPAPPSAATQARLERVYVDSGRQIRPVVEAILGSPELYRGPRMVKPPVVYCAGLLRARDRTITDGALTWQCRLAGQQLCFPPDVSGWDDDRWLDTSTTAGRWWLANSGLVGGTVTAPDHDRYPAESAEDAVAGALAFWGSPWLAPETQAALRDWAGRVLSAPLAPYRYAQRQNALRMLVAIAPESQTS